MTIDYYRMGTSRPALYHVLHDDIGFSSDDIQQLTYWVKFSFSKKNREKKKMFCFSSAIRICVAQNLSPFPLQFIMLI